MALVTDRQKCAHLLRRFGLGASEAELDFYLRDGLNGAIELLLNYDQTPEGFDLEPEALANQQGNLNPNAVSVWWVTRMISTARPLQEKMTLFWHDHFATSASKVTGGPLMAEQNEVLREHATGNFRTMLHAVSKDPAMLFWLDNQFNVKGKPNENFAREIMELFTLGIGHYTEQDIQEAARAFTGWTIGRGRAGQVGAQAPRRGATFVFRPGLHDNGLKTVFGKTSNFNGDDIIDLLCEMPRTATYIVTKLWEWFAYPNPETAVVDRLAMRFRQSNLNVKLLLRDIMRAPEFYSAKAERRVFKTPVDFCVATLRQLGAGRLMAPTLRPDAEGRVRPSPAAALTRQKMKAMGMDLLFPPDVNGWEHGPAWITSATMVERMSWATVLFGRAGRSIRYPAASLFQSEPTPSGAVKALLSIFDAELPANKVAILEKEASRIAGGALTAGNASEVAEEVSKLIFASPEFQFM